MKKLKRISQIIVAIFVLNLFSFNTSAQAAEQTPIVGQATASVAQMQKWAKSKGATDTFISLAPKYMELASKHGGINPVVAYAQSAVETGYGKFGGIIDESYHNPCGLKTSKGGDNDDPNAHQRFANWDQGISAHLDHLALYAGANGYPRSNTYDPRHFASIKGKAVYVEQLSGAWATDAQYAGKILKLKNEIENTKSSLIKLEEPINNQSIDGKLKVKGWVLDNSGIKSVKAYLDHTNYIGDLKYGIATPDVDKDNPGYVGGSNSGFEGTLDLSNYKPGTYELKIEAIANDGTKIVEKRIIKYTKKISRIGLEEPGNNVTSSGKLKIKGWVLDNSGIKDVKAYLDHTNYLGEVKYGLARPDIDKTYPGYTEGANSGFESTLDLSKFKPGTYELKVEATAKDGTKIIEKRIIKYSKLQSKIGLEEPTNNAVNNGELKIKGWALDSSGIKDVKAYLDHTNYIGEVKYGTSRPDIDKANPGYLEGINSGFEGTLNLGNYKPGTYELKVEATAKDGTRLVQKRIIKYSKQQSKIGLEDPINNTVSDGKLKIKGWALDSSGIKDVKAYLDHTNFLGEVKYGTERPDIDKANPGYSNALNSGFEGTLDLSKYNQGTYELKIEATANDGTKIVQKRIIKYSKKQSRIGLEEPINGLVSDGKLKIRGWALDSSGIKDVKAYLDHSNYLGEVKYGTFRPDVEKNYPGYVDGANSGFESTLDLSRFKPGTYELKVEVTAKDGTKIIEKRIIKYGKGTVVLDPGHRMFGADTGATGKHNGITYNEAELDLQLAMKTKSELENRGYKVVMTQTLNNMIAANTVLESLEKRVQTAENNNADLFVSIHHNSYDNSNAYGTEVWYSNPKKNPQVGATKAGQELAGKVATSIAKEGGFYNRGSKQSKLYVTYNTTMPSILVEAGFLTNANDAKKAASSSNQQKVARGMSSTIDTFMQNR